MQNHCVQALGIVLCGVLVAACDEPGAVDFHPELSRVFHREVSHL
jgi:hypothetical protein